MSCDRYLQRIRACHDVDFAAFEPWFVNGCAVGRVHRDRVAMLLVPGSPFVRTAGRLTLVGDNFAARSQRMAAVADRLAASGNARPPVGELYPVQAADAYEPFLAIDRSVVTWFGVHARGVHLNGYVVVPNGVALWIARRARGKRTYPGHLDNMVAGGQSIGFTAMATLRKECQEEAGIGADLVDHAVAAGTLSYAHQDGLSLKADTLTCFDLELPHGFTPQPVDGEVETFELWPLPVVASSLRGDGLWKPNCALVALHFLLRQGALDGELASDQRHRLMRALQGEVPA